MNTDVTVMKWMSWGPMDLDACPISTFNRIVELIQEEAKRREHEEVKRNE